MQEPEMQVQAGTGRRKFKVLSLLMKKNMIELTVGYVLAKFCLT